MFLEHGWLRADMLSMEVQLACALPNVQPAPAAWKTVVHFLAEPGWASAPECVEKRAMFAEIVLASGVGVLVVSVTGLAMARVAHHSPTAEIYTLF